MRKQDFPCLKICSLIFQLDNLLPNHNIFKIFWMFPFLGSITLFHLLYKLLKCLGVLRYLQDFYTQPNCLLFIGISFTLVWSGSTNHSSSRKNVVLGFSCYQQFTNSFQSQLIYLLPHSLNAITNTMNITPLKYPVAYLLYKE